MYTILYFLYYSTVHGLVVVDLPHFFILTAGAIAAAGGQAGGSQPQWCQFFGQDKAPSHGACFQYI